MTDATVLAQRPDRLRLFRVAARQSGYFTSDQAALCGFGPALLSYHQAKSGRFIRLRRGLYRLREFPSSPREPVVAAWLAAGKHIAAVSHWTALHVLGLLDVAPSTVHLTVPRSRRNLTSTAILKIHTTARPFARGDLTICDGMIVTSTERTILDLADAGAAMAELNPVIIRALERDMVTASDLMKGADGRSRRVSQRIATALGKKQSL